MKAYNMLKIKCNKHDTFSSIVDAITEVVKSHRYLFELSGSKTSSFRNDESMGRYYFESRIQNTPVQLLSNLDSNWIFENPNCNRSLNDNELAYVASEIDKSRKHDYSTTMIILDELIFEDGVKSTGTYGYHKAESLFFHAYNYLSNAIMISKASFDKGITIYFCMESKYRHTSLTLKIISIIGDILEEKIYYAPYSDEERISWNQEYEIEKKKFDRAVSDYRHNADLECIKENVEFGANESEKINIRSVLKGIVADTKWSFGSIIPDVKGITFSLNKNDKVLLFKIDSTHNGHYLQLLVKYESASFSFSSNIDYCLYILDKADAVRYCQNAIKIANYMHDQFFIMG